MIPKIPSMLSVGDIKLLHMPDEFRIEYLVYEARTLSEFPCPMVVVMHFRVRLPSSSITVALTRKFPVHSRPPSSLQVASGHFTFAFLLMLCRARSKARSILPPDFLIPSLLNYRSSSTSIAHDRKLGSQYDQQKLAAFPAPSVTPHNLHKNITERIIALHSGLGMAVPDENVYVFNTTASQLRQSLKEDLLAAGKFWSVLEERGLLHFLGPPHLEGYSTLISGLCPVNNRDAQWDEPRRKVAEEIALVAATNGNSTKALSTCMLFNITRKDPDATLELYRRYLELLKEKDELSEGKSGYQDHPNVLGLSLPDKPLVYAPGRSSVLLMAIAAHASKESFHNAIPIYAGTNIRISLSNLKSKLKVFHYDPALQKRVENYILRLDTARLVTYPNLLANHLNNCVQDRSITRIETLYTAILGGLSGPDAYLATSPEVVTLKKPIHVAEASWGCFLTAFIRCRQDNLAEKLWDDMIRLNIKPGVVMWTALFDGYDSLGLVEDTKAGWKTMLSEGVQPDASAYRSLISVLCTARKTDEALQALRTYEAEVSKGTLSSDSSLRVYNTLIHGLLTNTRPEDANAILHQMQIHGPKPDIVTYNTFLRYFSRSEDFASMGTILQRLSSDGLTGDAFTFTPVLSALLKAGRADAEEIMFNLMKKQNMAPNVGFYTALIDHQVRLCETKNLQSAINILRRMEMDPEVKANQVPYTSILAGIYRVQWLEPQVAEECREYILSRMRARKIRPNRVTYHILIAACLENPAPEGLQNALSLYREMRKNHVGMSNDTLYTILHGLIGRKEWALAKEIVEDMTKTRDVMPVGATADLVARIRKKAIHKMNLGPEGYF